MSLLTYSGLSTKLRAMSAKLLTEAQFRQIAQMPSVAAAAAYLKTTPTYGPCFAQLDDSQLHRSNIERVLSESVYEDLQKVYGFSNRQQRKCMTAYLQMYEVDFLKRCLECIFDHKDTEPALPILKELFIRHSSLDVEKLTAASGLDEFTAALKNTPYYEAFRRLIRAESPTIFDYEMALDIYHFSSLWKEKEKLAFGDDLKQLIKIFGSKFDLLNIQWIKRAKLYYHIDPQDIASFLIPVRYRLKKEEIRAMTEAEDLASLEAVMRTTYYGVRFEELNVETLEITYISIMKNILSRAAKAHPYSLAVIFNYFYQKRHEVTRLTIALECVRYGIDPETTMHRISAN